MQILQWDTELNNIGLPGNMAFGFGSQFGDIIYRLNWFPDTRFLIFKVDTTYYLIRQHKRVEGNVTFWIEDWTKQFNSDLEPVKKYAEEQINNNLSRYS